MKSLYRFITQRIAIILAVLLFVAGTVLGYLSEKKFEVEIAKTLETVHDNKIAAVEHLLKNQSVFKVDSATEDIIIATLVSDVNCEKDHSTDECKSLASFVTQNFPKDAGRFVDIALNCNAFGS
jgi:hypothetical protein